MFLALCFLSLPQWSGRFPEKREYTRVSRPASEASIAFLAEGDWYKFNNGLREWTNAGLFSEVTLLEIMQSNEPPLVRANAIIAWYSSAAYGAYWSKSNYKAWPNTPSEYLTAEVSEVLVNHLRNDNWRSNHQKITPIVEIHFDSTRSALGKALSDPDAQLATTARRAFVDHAFNEITPAIGKIILDSFEHYSGNRPFSMYSGGRGHIFMNSPLQQEWLVHHGEHFYNELLDWLLGGDAERKAIAAHVFARRGWKGYDKIVVDTLTSHLSSDGRRGNGFMAAQALFHLGERTLPFLESKTTYTDTQ